MDWSKGYSARYYMTILDKKTMKDIRRVKLKGGSIKRTLDNLRQSASLDCDGYDTSNEEYIRVWLDAEQSGDISHTPLFTGLAIAPEDEYEGYKKSNSLECYSVLKIAEDMLLPRGWYAPFESDGTLLIKDLLSVLNVPITIADTEVPRLKMAIVSETKENRLSMTDKILNAMNWMLRLNGDGSIYISPINNDVKLKIDAISNDIIENSINIKNDWYDAPNILRCIIDNDYAEVRDEDPDSPLSIQNRGREVWYEESDIVLGTNETLGEYTHRRLKELQRASISMSYDRRYWPDIYPEDIISISYPGCKVSGKFFITDQTVNLGGNARTSEEVIGV